MPHMDFLLLLLLACSLLQDRLENLDDLVTHLGRRLVTPKVLGPEVKPTNILLVEHLANGSLNGIGLLGTSKGVTEHHSSRQNSADGVGNTLASDVWCGAVNGLVDTHGALGRVRGTSKRSRWEETEGSGDDGSLVRDNVAKEILGNDNTVELAWVCDHHHGGRVDKVVLELELGVLGLHDTSEGLAPETGSGHDVCLVERGNLHWWLGGEGNLSCHTSDALDLGLGVLANVLCPAFLIWLNALSEV